MSTSSKNDEQALASQPASREQTTPPHTCAPPSQRTRAISANRGASPDGPRPPSVEVQPTMVPSPSASSVPPPASVQCCPRTTRLPTKAVAASRRRPWNCRYSADDSPRVPLRACLARMSNSPNAPTLSSPSSPSPASSPPAAAAAAAFECCSRCSAICSAVRPASLASVRSAPALTSSRRITVCASLAPRAAIIAAVSPSSERASRPDTGGPAGSSEVRRRLPFGAGAGGGGIAGLCCALRRAALLSASTHSMDPASVASISAVQPA